MFVCENNCRISTSPNSSAITNNLIYRLSSPFRQSAVSGVQNTRCEGFLAGRKCNLSPLVSGITYCSYSPPPTGREYDCNTASPGLLIAVNMRRKQDPVEKAISITYSTCVSVALVSRLAKRMSPCCVVCGLFGSTIFFPHYLINGAIFGKTLLNIKCVF